MTNRRRIRQLEVALVNESNPAELPSDHPTIQVRTLGEAALYYLAELGYKLKRVYAQEHPALNPEAENEKALHTLESLKEAMAKSGLFPGMAIAREDKVGSPERKRAMTTGLIAAARSRRTLTDAKVRRVLRLIKKGKSDKEISLLIGTQPVTIWSIRRGDTYRDVTLPEGEETK